MLLGAGYRIRVIEAACNGQIGGESETPFFLLLLFIMESDLSSVLGCASDADRNWNYAEKLCCDYAPHTNDWG